MPTPTEYAYPAPGLRDTTHQYLWPPVIAELQRAGVSRVFDLGCGNGGFLHRLAALGIGGVGVDPSTSGVGHATSVGVEAHLGSAYDDLASVYGQFPAVVSLEVVEHLYDPRAFATTLHSLVEPGGLAIVSTPYHGYLKNLVLALTGRLPKHWEALRTGGHIKFFTPDTLEQLLLQSGFMLRRTHYVGRVPIMAKSMVAVCEKPSNRGAWHT